MFDMPPQNDFGLLTNRQSIRPEVNPSREGHRAGGFTERARSIQAGRHGKKDQWIA